MQPAGRVAAVRLGARPRRPALVVREPAEHSRRSLALRMSPSGAALLVRYDDDRLAALRKALREVTDPDAVLAAVAALSRAMQPAEPAVAS